MTSKYRKTSQNHWEFMLKKKDSTRPFWKRLIKSAEKCSWIAVDWNHFTAEGDDDDEMNGTGGKDWGDLDGMFKQMGAGGGGGGGGVGLGGASGADLNDLDDEGTDSDDEPMPDLEDVPKTDDEKAKSNVANEQTK
ncbi:unnamed protein product [Rotaria sp. Silwood1]|nr:unnamed protein product [Rotaria sp. Silwood1]